MTSQHTRRAISAIAASALVVSLGCSEDSTSDSNPSTGGSAGASGAAGVGGGGNTSGSGGSAGATPATVTISGVAYSLGGGTLTEGDACFISEGAADLCAPITGPSNPTYRIEGVPTHTAGAVRFRRADTTTFYWVLTTEAENIEFTLSIETPAIVQGYYDQTSTKVDPDGVVVLAEIYPGPKADYQAVLTPSSGDGPYYYSTGGGTIDTSTTTTSSGIAMGVFLNVDRKGGPYLTSFSRAAETCDSPSFGGALVPWTVPDDADVVYVPFTCP